MEDPSRSNSGRQVYGVESCDIVYDYDKGTDDDREVNLKVKTAFEGVKSFPFSRIIFQFWRPLDDGGRLVLESFRNTYAVSPYDRLLRDKYLFSLIDNNHNPNPAWIIRGGPVVTAFLNHFPECSMKHPALLLPIFIELKRELQRVGLSIYHLQGSCSYKATDLEPAKIEIKKALEIACESHDLSLGQVYTCCLNFYDEFDVSMGEGLVWKTLQTHRPHLCRNIYKLSDNRGVLALLSKSKCASFVICLRSTHSGDVDYALEFFWPCSRNNLILLETLLLTLSKYLPSFKFASGEQLGDELFVVDVENSSLNKILPVKKLSEATPKASYQSPLTNINNDDDYDDDDLAVLATYRNESMLFYLPSSSTFENVMEKLNKEFELDLARTYKVEYEVSPGQWSSLACLESCRRIEDMGLIKLRVLATVGEVRWRWRTNT
ncbi:hypothetical protein L1987_80597 [Smallanthus sonchifolius]|uniref:Uncharacterized protein n=1 Tax=Smallanthus sonchifolius TaxID=185202 RepID=A0ACB8YNQ1_9ASTR|nr:hypothetical protein L1987_80597 [Smallanthus sonchifolius]